MELHLQSLFGLLVTWCAHLFSLAETQKLPPSPPPHILGRYWSAKIDDISYYGTLTCCRTSSSWLWGSWAGRAATSSRTSLRWAARGSGPSWTRSWAIPPGMDEWTIKTPNPLCRLFFKLTCKQTAAFCLTDFIDWRYIHSWLVFSTQLVNCCPHGQRNYTCVLLPLYILSYLLPPPPLPKLNVQYILTVCVCGVGGCWVVL